MERKTFKFEVKSVNELEGTFEGILSAFRKTPDKAKDIARPGCFKKTASENPEIPALYMHDIMQPVGKMAIEEIDKGLHVNGQLIKGIQKAEECLLLMKAGVIKTLSMGYDTIQRELKDGIRYLTEVKVYEGSLVIGDFACDDEALITSVKTRHGLKAATFDETYQQNILASSGYRMLDTLALTIDNILYDPDIDKAAELDAAITDFHSAYIGWVKEVIDAGLLKADKAQFETKAKAIKDNFRALLKTIEVKQEPASVTPAVKDDSEAAHLETALNDFDALVTGFDASKAEHRIDELLAKL